MQECKIQIRQFIFNAGLWDSREAVHVECRNIRFKAGNSCLMQEYTILDRQFMLNAAGI
jgi:hypothetical protein